MERAAREAAHFPAAMMELKRAAAPSGRQRAWPRRHRTTAKPGQRQRCTPPAVSRRGPGAPAFWAVIADQVRPKGAWHRVPFLQPFHSNPRALHPRARSVRRRARVVHRRARLGHRGGQLLLEWVWSSLAFPFPSNVIRRWRLTIRQVDQPPTLRAVLSKEWPYDGRIWGHISMRPAIRRTASAAQPNGAALSTSVPFSRQEAQRFASPSQVA